jgi:hypothetical protein
LFLVFDCCWAIFAAEVSTAALTIDGEVPKKILLAQYLIDYCTPKYSSVYVYCVDTALDYQDWSLGVLFLHFFF